MSPQSRSEPFQGMHTVGYDGWHVDAGAVGTALTNVLQAPRPAAFTAAMRK